jgi:hypothetical protein
MATAASPIEYPSHFRGIFDEVRVRHGRHLDDAIRAIRAMPISDDLRPALAYQTWDNPQPSFILFPLIFLATAEASGGITVRHREHLPVIMLIAELLAVADDTVDRCMRRSGRDTFAYRFGDASALPLVGALEAIVLSRSRRCDERLFEAAAEYFMRFFPLELCERAHTYPDPALYDSWLEHRHAQATWSTKLILDSALVLNERPPWPVAAVAALNRIGQDIDDVVNIVEFREAAGENDDLLSGVVTQPMLHAIDASPGLGEAIAALWDIHRPLAREQLSIAAYHARRAALVRETLPAYLPIRAAILTHGVPATLAGSREDVAISVRESPDALRPLMHQLATAFLERARVCDVAEVR